MRRVVQGIPGDIRLLPMEESVWAAQIVLSEVEVIAHRNRELREFVKVW
jgi:hypothetical protein